MLQPSPAEHPNTPYSDIGDWDIFVHNDKDIPQFLNPDNKPIKNKVAWDIQGLRIDFEPVLKSFDNALIDQYSMIERNCRFPQESYGLKFSKTYSRQNCIFECQVKSALDKCKCVPWYIPKLEDSQFCDLLGMYI